MARRQLDPTAQRLLAELERLEKAPWPDAQTAYAAVLLALATRCEAPAGKAEVYRWLLAVAGGVLFVRDETRRQCREDALRDLIAECAGLLQRARVGLDPATRPNLRSLLTAQVIWRANNLFESRHARHARRAGQVLAVCPLVPAPSPNAVAAVLARQVGDRLDLADPRDRALLFVAMGYSIAEAARKTGCSRQQIYRAQAALAERCGWHDE